MGSPQEKPELARLCPNINLITRRINLISQLVATQVLRAKKRSHAYERFIYTALKLKELHNYEAAQAVVSGLTWPAVDRLNTISEIKGPLQQRAIELKTFFGPEDKFRQCKQELA